MWPLCDRSCFRHLDKVRTLVLASWSLSTSVEDTIKKDANKCIISCGDSAIKKIKQDKGLE